MCIRDRLQGKLTANAIRVPTPNVSLAIMKLTFENEHSKEELNSFLRNKAFHSELKDQIDFTSSPEMVSNDFVGSRYACIVDSAATLSQSNNAVFYVWYDNEFGYSVQLLRVAKQMAGIKYPRFPKYS